MLQELILIAMRENLFKLIPRGECQLTDGIKVKIWGKHLKFHLKEFEKWET